MRHTLEVRGPIAGLAVVLAGSWSMPAAFAACGMAAVGGGASGPPSISATETSTTQVLEQVRRRTQDAQTPVPIPVVNTTQSSAVEEAASDAPAAEAAAASSAEAQTSTASKPVTAAKPAVKASPATSPSVSKPKAIKQVQAAKSSSTAVTYEKAPTPADDYAIAEQAVAYGDHMRKTAVWGQGFLGYDRHKNLAPGNQENPTRTAVTGGGMIGADWTHVSQSNGVQAIQYGVFTGYSATKAKLSDTNFAANDTDGPPDTLPGGVGNASYIRTDNDETIDGPFIGAYMAYVKDAWTYDVAVKADFFQLDQSSNLEQVCGGIFGTQNGSASVHNYMIAGNIAHRYDLDDRKWWSPVVGARFTYTDFGNDPSFSVFSSGPQAPGRLGLEDGSALRLQIGARLGDVIETADGMIWTTTVGMFLYSDVLITGFDSVAGQTGEAVGPVDEGKLRAMAQLETRIAVGNGVSYMFQGEIRGGGDVFGASGQIGMRYEW